MKSRYWVAHRRPPRAAPALAAVVGVVSVAGASAFSVWTIQRDLEQRTIAALERDGAELSELDVDFSYRDGRIAGPVDPEIVDRAAALTGVRELDVSDSATPGGSKAQPDAPSTSDGSSTSDSPATADEPAATPPSVVMPGQVDVSVQIAAGLITLTGSVHTEEQRNELVDAASQRVGAGNVIDELTIVQTGSPGPLTGLSTVLADLPAGVSGEFVLIGDDLTFIGLAPSAAAADELAEILDMSDRTTALELDIVDAPESSTSSTTTTTTSTPSATTTSSTSVPTSTSTTPTTSTPVTSTSGGDASGDLEALQAALDALAPNIAENVVFSSSSDDLDSAAATALNDVVDLLTEYPELSLVVTGHTDDRGDEDTNLKLSASRAEAVVLYMTRQGIDRSRLQFEGAGESQPIADNSTTDGQRANRRVVFTAVNST